MDDPLDLSYYLGGSALESVLALDIAIGSGDIVSIDELPEDPQELVGFLQGENCSLKYWILVSKAYLREGKPSDALGIATLGLDADFLLESDKHALHSLQGWIYMKSASEGINRLENLNKASDEFSNAGDPSDPSNLLAKAQLHVYRDEAEAALRIYDELLKKDSNNCLALLGKAQMILRKTQNYANALKIYQQVLVINPAIKPDPRIGIGICFWFLKDREMAIKSWARAIELDSSNFKAKLLSNLASFDSVFLNSLSDNLFLEGYKSSLQELSQLQLQNNDDNVVLLALCSFFYSKGKFDVVEKIASKISSSATSSDSSRGNIKLSTFESKVVSSASYWMGRISYSKGDFAQAQKCFHEATRVDENNLLAKVALGQSQLSRDSVEEAILSFESVLKSNPKCLEAIYLLGSIYAKSSSKTKQEQAIQMLERYIRLSNNRGSAVANQKDAEALLNKEPIALNAYLILSKLYETQDLAQSLTYLHKAIESREQIKQAVPLEVYNNVGVFNFSKNQIENSVKYFNLALSGLEEPSVSPELKSDLKISLLYNLARTTEAKSTEEAISMYEEVLQECSTYVSAKLRLLFLDAVSTNKTSKNEIEQELKTLLDENASDMEIRSFYGWFIKTFGKRIGLQPDAESIHQKETLVKFDSHDSYALISLANIYCIMAKELKGSKEDEKRRKYFIRAIELYTKVLSIDPKNVFAAQGLGMVYIENKEQTKGLDILRKIRDSLNDISVYLNLGHVLTDIKQYAKAVESYEIALVRFTDNQDFKIIGFLGRAWYLRGIAEKSLPYLKKSLQCSEEALAKATGVKSSLRYNVSFIQFQIADFITKLPIEERSLDDINEAITNLNFAIETLNSLASKEEEHPPYPKSELKARADLGETTLLNRLNASLDETRQSIAQLEGKLEEAKKLREEAEAKRVKEQELIFAERKAREEQIALERAKLQEQATQWVEESRQDMIVNDSDDEKFDENDEKAKLSKLNGKKKGGIKGKGSKKKNKKKKDLINDSDDDEPSAVESEPEADMSSDGEAASTKKKAVSKKGGKRKRRAIEDEEDDGAEPGQPVAETSSKKKKTHKSEETVEDSSDQDDLF